MPCCAGGDAGRASLAACDRVGGVPKGRWADAPGLDTVAARVAAAVRGCTLVGHGLTQDLQHLGLEHPKCPPPLSRRRCPVGRRHFVC